MKRFEYMEFHYTDKYCMKQLKDLGMEGWEVIVGHGTLNHTFLLKRELPDELSPERQRQAAADFEYSR